MYAHSHDAIVKYVTSSHNYHFKWLMVIIHMNSTFLGNFFPPRWEIFTSFSTRFAEYCESTQHEYMCRCLFSYYTTRMMKKRFFTTWKLFFLFVPTGKVTNCILQFFVQKPTRKLFSRLSLTPPPHNALSHNESEWEKMTNLWMRATHKTYVREIIYIYIGWNIGNQII